MSNSIFIARKPKTSIVKDNQIFKNQFNQTPSSGSETSLSTQTSSGLNPPSSAGSQIVSNLIELTKNDKYCVSRLPASPAVLNANNTNFLNGYSDDSTQYSLIVNENDIYAWNYTSTDGIPVTIHFPVESNQYNILPLAILVSPSAGSKDPGLVVINAFTGHIKFYEAISAAPALGIINNKSIEFTYNLNNEFITMAENVEPAGIMIATSSKRCFLVSLRDAAGRPALQKIEVLPSRRSFFNTFKKKSNVYQINENDDQIIAIRSSKALGQGTREVIIQDSNGEFNSFSCNRNGITRSTSASITSQCTHQIDGYLPGSDLNFKVLDIQPMLHIKESKDVYLVLASCNKTFQLEMRNLMLFTVKIDDTGVLVYSTNRITRLSPSYYDKPTLFLPKPYNTAFVISEKSIVLTDVLDSIDPNHIHKPKWEDVITFRENVNIIGQGYEDKEVSETTSKILKNASVIIITDHTGVLRIERFEDPYNAKDFKSVEPSSFIKSHVEQAVFYDSNDSLNPVEFNVPKDMDLTQDDFIIAIVSVSNEILKSSSVYIPPFLPSIKEHLYKRCVSSIKLIEYVQSNFPNISIDVKLLVLENLEKMSLALNLWSFIENSKNSEKFAEILKNCIVETLGKDKILNDSIRFFFSNEICEINQVFTKYITSLLASNVDIEVIGSIVVDCLSRGVYDNEIKYREELFNIPKTQIGDTNLWLFNTDLIFKIDNIFEKLIQSNTTKIETVEFKELQPVLVKFVELLFYLFDNAINYLSAHSNSKSNDKILHEYKNYYENRKTFWNKSLVSFGCESQALVLSEVYEDFKSLAEIMDTERDLIINKYGTDSDQYELISNSFDYYFNKFEYKFGAALYEYYSVNGKLQTLLLSFPQYNAYLRTYLSNDKHGKISWIRDVLDSRFIDSATTLLKVSKNNDDLQTNRKLQLSFAKLSILASNDKSESVKELYEESNQGLELIYIQEVLFGEILNFVNYQRNNLQIEFIMNNFSKKLQEYDFESLGHILKRSLIRLIENKSLGINELIDSFTLIDQTTTELKNNFYWALKVISITSFNSSDLKNFNEHLVWQRLLLLDDWESITNTDNKTDAYVQEKVEGTILFNTVLLAFKDGLLSSDCINSPDLNQLTSAIIPTDLLSQRYQYLNESSINALQEEIYKQQTILKGIIDKYGLDNWFKSIISSAKNVSGDFKELVDYSSLKMVS